MWFSSWLRNLRSAGNRRRCERCRPAPRCRPRLESLEDRLTPSTVSPQAVFSSPPSALETVTAPRDDRHARSQTYLALGDSIAFGETNFFPRTYGDQGYVRAYADWLATQNDGVRPEVINLAIIGETSATYFDANAPGIAPHTAAAAFNLNYTNPALSQEQMLRATIASEKAAGHIITHVSFALGINDFAYLQQTHPELLTLRPAQQQALIGETFASVASNDIKAVAEIRELLPHAQLLLLDYFNALGVLGPQNPVNQLEIPIFKHFEQLVQAEAALFHGTFVDIYQPFVGHEADYTFILSGNTHPNDLGYSVIAQQMIQASSEHAGLGEDRGEDRAFIATLLGTETQTELPGARGHDHQLSALFYDSDLFGGSDLELGNVKIRR